MTMPQDSNNNNTLSINSTAFAGDYYNPLDCWRMQTTTTDNSNNFYYVDTTSDHENRLKNIEEKLDKINENYEMIISLLMINKHMIISDDDS